MKHKVSSALRAVNKFFPKVMSVVDATRPANIEVTNRDVSTKGIKDHTECAMAVACKRKFHLDGVIISRSVAYLVKGTVARRFQLPPSVSREVVSFDRGAGFATGKYSLSAISPTGKLGHRTGGSKDKKSGNGAPKRLRHLTANVRTVLGGQEPED